MIPAVDRVHDFEWHPRMQPVPKHLNNGQIMFLCVRCDLDKPREKQKHDDMEFV